MSRGSQTVAEPRRSREKMEKIHAVGSGDHPLFSVSRGIFSSARSDVRRTGSSCTVHNRRPTRANGCRERPLARDRKRRRDRACNIRAYRTRSATPSERKVSRFYYLGPRDISLSLGARTHARTRRENDASAPHNVCEPRARPNGPTHAIP